nr:MAG TPA: hypothetical protein [Caudoviricetes sp.]
MLGGILPDKLELRIKRVFILFLSGDTDIRGGSLQN